MQTMQSLNQEAITVYPQILALTKKTATTQTSSLPGPPTLSPPSLSITYSLSTADAADYKDRAAFSSLAPALTDENKYLESLHSLVQEGTHYISFLYTYRSVSKALPMVQGDTKDEDKLDLHTKTFAVLRPSILKFKELMEFSEKATKTVTSAVAFLIKQDNEKQVPSDPLCEISCAALDLLLLLDALKDMKACITNDFSRYKRAFTPIRTTLSDSDALMEEIHQLQMYLSNPQQPHNLLYFHLKTDIQKLQNYDVIVCQLISFCCDAVDNKTYLLSTEYHRYFRLLPSLLYLLDSDDKNDKKAMNVFRYTGKGKLEIDRVRKNIKLLPIVPLYMDMHIDVLFVLKRCNHWEEDRKGEWMNNQKNSKQSLLAKFDLIYHRQRIRQEYMDYLVAFQSQYTHINTLLSVANPQPLPAPTLRSFFNIVLTGLRLLSSWQGKVMEQCSFKYAFPATAAEYAAKGGKVGEGIEYAQAIKYNYSNEDLYTLVDIIGIIKSLGSVLITHTEVIDICVRRCIHDDIQIFLQLEVSIPLRKANKANKKDLAKIMFNMREICGDWLDYGKQRDEYLIKRTDAQLAAGLLPGKDFPRRSVAPSPLQIALLRRMTHTIYSDKSAGMQGGMFTKKDLKKDQIESFSAFYENARFFPYLLSFASTVRQLIDTSFLWYREFYLEITKCIQFPISMSLPWILTEYLILSFFSSFKPSLFYPLDIYDDCSSQALYILKQQFLYDEIESESNLSLEQLVYHLSIEIFKFYVSWCQHLLCKSGYEKKWREKKEKDRKEKERKEGKRTNTSNINKWEIKEARFASLLQQRTITLLGRSINLHLLMTNQINVQLRSYLENIIRRFESGDITNVVEFAHLLSVFQLLHATLTHHLPSIDNYTSMFREMNESTTLGQFKGKIILHIFSEMVSDLVSCFAWNDATNRFVKAPGAAAFVSKEERSKPPPLPVHYYYGHHYASLYLQYFASFKEYFGHEHIEALIHVIQVTDIPLLISELQSELHNKLFLDFYPFSIALLQGLPLFKTPSIKYGILGTYGFFDVKLRTSLGVYTPLRPNVLHNMREIGNLLLLIREIETILLLDENFSFLQLSHVQGIKGRKGRERQDVNGIFLIPSPQGANHSFNFDVGATTPVTNSGPLPSYYKQLKELNSSSLLPPTARDALSHIFALADDCKDMYEYNESRASRLMFAGVVGTMVKSIDGVYEKWMNERSKEVEKYIHPSSVSSNTASEDKNDMVRLLSCLLFMFNQPYDETDKKDMYLGRDVALFGDGFLYCIAFLCYGLGITHKWWNNDLSLYVFNLEALYPIDRARLRENIKKNKGKVNETERQEILILEFFRNVKVNQDKIKAYWEGLERIDLRSNFRCIAPRDDKEINEAANIVQK